MNIKSLFVLSAFAVGCSSNSNEAPEDFRPKDEVKASSGSSADADPQEMKPISDEGFERVKKWKDLVFVGVRAPSFTAFSEKSRQYLTQSSPPGKFFVYFHHSDMPSVCLDKDCGDIATPVNAKGGRFMGFSDPKAVESLGILRRGKAGFEVYPSLVVFADKNSVVKAIFIRAQLSDLPKMMKEAGY